MAAARVLVEAEFGFTLVIHHGQLTNFPRLRKGRHEAYGRSVGRACPRNLRLPHGLRRAPRKEGDAGHPLEHVMWQSCAVALEWIEHGPELRRRGVRFPNGRCVVAPAGGGHGGAHSGDVRASAGSLERPAGLPKGILLQFR